jgi:hypothetical protein
MRPTRSPPTRTSARVTRWTTVFMPRSMIQLVGVSLSALVVLMLGELVPDAGAASTRRLRRRQRRPWRCRPSP